MRIIGTETEFGIIGADASVNAYARAIELSTRAVKAYENSRMVGRSVAWDYAEEDPLLDLRGRRLARAAAHTSQLTDAGGSVDGVDVHHLEDVATELQENGEGFQPLRAQPANLVTTAGARLYVDHAHPEYSAPETRGPLDTVLWDRAGEVIAREIMQADPQLVLFKNNVDGKGASWGAHENYLIDRQVPFAQLVDIFTTFFVMRPVLCGAGRVGGGQRGEQALFQISQRADYIENTVGLETTFNRPIINTRDEPHALSQYRRFHVIGGDANRYDVSALMRFGSTAMVAELLEVGGIEAIKQLPLLVGDPVDCVARVSRDLGFSLRYETTQGPLGALEILAKYLQVARQYLATNDPQTRLVDQYWAQTLVDLAALNHQLSPAIAAIGGDIKPDLQRVTRRLEWLAKYQLFAGLAQRYEGGWDDPKLRAADLRWADLSPGNLVEKLRQSGRVEELFSGPEIEAAALNAPKNTRANARGRIVASDHECVRANWVSVTVQKGPNTRLRIALNDPKCSYETVVAELEEER